MWDKDFVMVRSLCDEWMTASIDVEQEASPLVEAGVRDAGIHSSVLVERLNIRRLIPSAAPHCAWPAAREQSLS
jgi:hypothetical protein